jgi:hypothetical protein
LHAREASVEPHATVAEELQTGRLVEVEVEDLPYGYQESALVCLKRNLPLNKILQEFVDEIDIQAKDTRELSTL